MQESPKNPLQRRHFRNLALATLLLVALMTIASLALHGNLTLLLLIFVSIFAGLAEGLKYLGVPFYLLLAFALILIITGIARTGAWALASYFVGLILLAFCGLTGIGQHY